MNSKTRQIFALISIFTLIVLLMIVIVNLTRIGKNKINLTILPTYATATMNGEKIPNKTTLYLKPGDYSFEVKAEDFVTMKKTVHIKESQHLDLALLPANNDGRAWVQQNSKLYTNVEERGGTAAREKGAALINRYPVVELLPYSDGSFNLGYVTPDGTAESFKITVHATTPLGRQLALSQLRVWGYEPAEYPIDFVDFSNPLGSEG